MIQKSICSLTPYSVMKIFLLTLFLVSCSSTPFQKIRSVKSWGYQLQNYHRPYGLERIYGGRDRLWVIDYNRDGIAFARHEIELLKQNNNVILAYLSLGKGNDRVRYWDERWSKMIFQQLDQIMKAGFNGVLLDNVDAFWQFPDKQKRADQMVDLIGAIRKYSQKRNSDFLLLQQNASSIIHYTTKKNALYFSVDGLVVESAFFFGLERMNNAYNPQTHVLENIRLYKEKGKPVFSVEYLNQKNQLKKYAEVAKENHIVPLAADKELSGQLYFSEDINAQ